MAFGAVSGFSDLVSSTDGLLDSASPDGGLLASDSPVGGLLSSASPAGWAVGLTDDDDEAIASLVSLDVTSVAATTGLGVVSAPSVAIGFGITGTNPPKPCGVIDDIPDNPCLPDVTGGSGAAVSPVVAPSAVLTYGSSVACWNSSSTGDGGAPSSFVPGIPGSANVSASEVTSGAAGSTCDCVAGGAVTCTAGTDYRSETKNQSSYP